MCPLVRLVLPLFDFSLVARMYFVENVRDWCALEVIMDQSLWFLMFCLLAPFASLEHNLASFRSIFGVIGVWSW